MEFGSDRLAEREKSAHIDAVEKSCEKESFHSVYGQALK